ncbi:hypothetical protein MHPYR_710015 [uncultured Mycobacterium sp.]|uniref:Uncharacterized protein n=1 Tax=uncultured Mycobacterium sp. TaxID=171292 RepID=A0A1Y5PTR8_9MYCO|nr:hypothetical protein MHPYR_710015 [uncultured Mycobacterium sp.]
MSQVRILPGALKFLLVRYLFPHCNRVCSYLSAIPFWQFSRLATPPHFSGRADATQSARAAGDDPGAPQPVFG